ncbi:MAG: hypothetical protein FWH43_03615 [Endomicrobia bacterium]|nr:hypothetical protein [Endomicrobiia bacterium]
MKKTKKILSWLTAAAIVCNASSLSFAAVKRDVNDPVLREIINELSKKMPKFIDKYGETVFVEDEPITRGALISAIYEYDRRTKPSSAAEAAEPGGVSQITKQEFDALKAKVSSLEKSGAASAKASSKSEKSSVGDVDMIALITNLEPNMPMLLDNSLNNSKVFKQLQQQIAGAKPSGKDVSYAPLKDVTDINSKLDILTKRVTTAETSIANSAKSSSDSGVSYAGISKDITNMNTKLEQLSKRLASAETNITSASKTSKASSASVSQKEIDDLKSSLTQIQQSYVKLSKRVDELNNDRSIVTASSSGKSSSEADMSYINSQLSDIKKTVAGVPTSAEIKNEINRSKNQTQADIERIERRLNSISSYSAKPSSPSSESSGGGATIATISLGITMIAALFVAR